MNYNIWGRLLSSTEESKKYATDIFDDTIQEYFKKGRSEVAIHSAKEASEILKCDVLKNDSGLCIDALNGFPGPYTHYVDDTLGEEGILKLMKNIDDRRASLVEALAYCKYGEEPTVFTSITKGVLAHEKSGTYGWSWDYIFIPDGQEKTLANYPDNERFLLWNQDAYKKLAKYLKNSSE